MAQRAPRGRYKWLFGELPEREEVEQQYTRKHTGKPSWWPSRKRARGISGHEPPVFHHCMWCPRGEAYVQVEKQKL